MFRRKKQLREALELLAKATAALKDMTALLDNSVEQNRQTMETLGAAIASSDSWQRLFTESKQEKSPHVAAGVECDKYPILSGWVN
jgi:hypothetical protein